MENLTDATEKVKKLEELLAEGIITEKEFKRKNKQLLKKEMTKKEYGKVEQITDATEKVKELEELLAEGVINKKEFKIKKKQLLKKKMTKRRKKEIEQISDEIEKLKKLKESLDSGIITQREFKRKKKQLLKKKITILDVIRDILSVPIIIVAILLLVSFVLAVRETFVETFAEEQFAIDYLVEFSDTFKNPRSIELYKVWVYTDSLGNFYVAYNLSATNSFGAEMEAIYGNDYGIEYLDANSTESIDSAKRRYLLGMDGYWEKSNYLEAVENGRILNAKKIQKAFEKTL